MKNGMLKWGDAVKYSIMQDEKKCYISGRTDWLECHHIFGGPNREHSTKYGLVVWLNHYYHNEPKCCQNAYLGGVHFNKELMQQLRADGQRKFEETHSHEEFMRIFGENYI